MDFHKMLLTSALATALIFREGQHSFTTFSQKAQYLFAESGDKEWFNLARRTFECTKYMMSLKVFSILQGRVYLRITLSNPFTQEKGFVALLDLIEQHS